MDFLRRQSKEFSKTRFIRLARRTIAIGTNPIRMLSAKSIVNFLLKLKEGRPTYVGHPAVRVAFVIPHSDFIMRWPALP